MRTKAHDWLDVRSSKPLYGIKVFCNGMWMNVVDGERRILLYDTKEERDEKRKELRRIENESMCKSVYD